MDQKINVSVVSYLNSKPFIFGLRNSAIIDEVNLSEDIPSVCAEKLLSGEADIGLVPVAVLPQLKKYKIISNYCIGADGKVGSVMLLSDVPLNDIKIILLDYQSRTSVLLSRILAKELWKINPQWKKTSEHFEKNISGNTAGIVIGDRALIDKKKFKYTYDLPEEWKKLTGLPFAFASWVSVKELSDKFISDFNSALQNGLMNIPRIAREESSAALPETEIRNYLENCIDYNFNEEKKKAMEIFLEKAGQFSSAL